MRRTAAPIACTQATTSARLPVPTCSLTCTSGPGGELYVNPEYYQGFGLGITHGLAAFSNGAAYKVGKYRGDVFIPRLWPELNRQRWAARYGIFTVPRVPNGLATDGHYTKAWQQSVEIEGRSSLLGHSGKVRLLGYLERANMGSYRAVLDNPNLDLDLAGTRRYRLTYAFVLNVEQEITKDLGTFLRLAFRDPNYEVWQYADVSRSLEVGLSLKGTAWKRPNDRVGLAEMLDGLGHAQRAYFNAGGLGILIGDGKLPHYGLENVMEAYYNFEVAKGINLTLDYQFAANPAYNQDRGPVNIFAARLRVRF